MMFHAVSLLCYATPLCLAALRFETPLRHALPLHCCSVPCYSAVLSMPSAVPFPLLQVLPLLPLLLLATTITVG